MNPATLKAWRGLLRADGLAELELGCLQAARDIIGSDLVVASWLLLRETDRDADGWLLATDPARRARLFLECPLADDLLITLEQHPGVRLLDGLPQRMLRARLRQLWTEPAYLPAQTIAVPLGANVCHDGLWLIGLKGAPTPSPEALEMLEQGGLMLNIVGRRVLKYERMHQINGHLRHLHEMLHSAMLAADEPALFDTVLRVAARQFGFERVFLALLNAEQTMLHTAVHTGFHAAPDPILPPAEHNLFLPLLQRGELIVTEPGHPLMEQFPAYGAPSRERCAFLPLASAGRPLGFIYADQLEPAGTPLYREVLEIFARQTATALENLKHRLHAERRAETDPLTGLHNRAYLDRLLQLEIPRVRRYNHPISLLMIDLCEFKRVNDTHGHLFGDFLLRETAQLLKNNIRLPDVAVRYGGDEFVVVMVNTGPEQAERVKRRIEEAFISRNRLQDDERTMINISIGLRSATAETLGDLLHDADQAMYAQKARQKRHNLVNALISGQTEKIEAADKVVGNLCMMLYKKAPFYPDHARRVAALAALLGRRLGLHSDELEVLVLSALLHGIGKVSLPAEILMKPSALTEGEMQAIRNHVQIGQELFEGIEHLDPLRPILRAHHERFDGDLHAPENPAYPDGIAGERIPLAARILKLAEAVDAIATDRPWRAGRGPEEALRIARAESGLSFDPRLVRTLLSDHDWMEALEKPGALIDRMLAES